MVKYVDGDELFNDEYRLPGDEPIKQRPVRYEKPDTTEYMMRQVRPDEVHNPNVKPLDPYNYGGPYAYGKRKKK